MQRAGGPIETLRRGSKRKREIFRLRMAPIRGKRGKEKNTPIPEGWILTDHVEPDGKVVKCYTNVIGQKFFSLSALLRYVEVAKKEQFSIYEPGFDPSTLVDTSSEDGNASPEEVLPSELEGNSKAKASELNVTSNTVPPTAGKVKEQAGETSAEQKSSTHPPTSGRNKRKDAATAAARRVMPPRASKKRSVVDPDYILDTSAQYLMDSSTDEAPELPNKA